MNLNFLKLQWNILTNYSDMMIKIANYIRIQQFDSKMEKMTLIYNVFIS